MKEEPQIVSKSKSWEMTERIVSALEKFITPESEVRHNVRLAVVGRSDRRLRQCDVVITHNNGLRKFMAIVEVQKRKRRPDITTFHGWVKKKEELGAHLLICVSELGFPESIITEVKNRYGDTVVLMTLLEFDYIANPQRFNMVNFFVAIKKNIEIEDSSPMVLEIPEGYVLSKEEKAELGTTEKLVDFHEKLFSFSMNEERCSLADIIQSSLNAHPHFDAAAMQSDVVRVPIGIEQESNMYYNTFSSRFRISSWSFTAIVTIKKEARPNNVSQYVYRQEIENDTLVWVSAFEMTVDGERSNYEMWTKSVNGELKVELRQLNKLQD